MARGRMINQSIAEDIEFNEMSIEAQLMFVRTVPFLDRDGLINGHPAILAGKVAPLLIDMFGRIPGIITEWTNAGLVIQYQDGKVTVLYFTGFTQNQANMRYDREPASQFAPPPEYVRTAQGLQKTAMMIVKEPEAVPPTTDGDDTVNDDATIAGSPPVIDDCGTMPEDCRQSSGIVPEGIPPKRREEKRREENNSPPLAVDSSSVFSLWQNNMPGTLTEIISHDLGDLIDTYGAPEVGLAIRLAVEANKRNVRYVRGILVRRAAGDEHKPKAIATPPPPVGISGELGFSLATI